MRKVINGAGVDTTAAVQAWLMATDDPMERDLILIGAPEDSRSIWLTDHEAPVLYSPYGTFYQATVSRDQVQAKVGLDSQTLTITWSPSNIASTSSMSTASPMQLARQHIFDNWPVRIFRCYMPKPGDADTFGCSDWFGGRVNTAVVQRGKIVFNVASYLDVLTQKVPNGVIEVTNTLAATAAVTIPSGDASIPVFKCVTGSTENHIIADCTSPTAGKIYSGNKFAGGYMVFLSGDGATLAGAWSAIGENGKYSDGSNDHSDFEIYSELPWPPTAGVDTFYVSMSAPTNLEDESYYGFPYVPSPQSSV